MTTESPSSAVHPHACGEHRGGSGALGSEYGSPPRMWGTRTQRLSHIPFRRFTPTHVGNTGYRAETILAPAVHPHACGEHWCRLNLESRNNGSPPRMWGTQNRMDVFAPGERFTPTHVGNTKVCLRLRLSWAVHPHACGEHRCTESAQAQKHRFTPTHVGNTVRRSTPPGGTTVHPHACGEHSGVSCLTR